MEVELTPAEAEILELVKEWFRIHGKPPTYQEMAEARGFINRNSPFQIVGRLVAKGKLVRGVGKSRSIGLVGKPGCCAACGHPLEDQK